MNGERIRMRIYLVRHGETDWNAQGRFQGREDIPLNENGIRQAHECGKVFEGIDIDFVITSPLKRAKQTAEIIASYVGRDHVVLSQNLIERELGKLSGLNKEERKKVYESGEDLHMEEFDKLCNRVMDELYLYMEKKDCKNIIMVAHGAALNAILAVVSNFRTGTGKLRLKNVSISVIESMEVDSKTLASGLPNVEPRLLAYDLSLAEFAMQIS